MGPRTVERAQDLPQAVQDLLLESVGDLPPFGLHLYVLQLRLERDWGLVVTREAIHEFYSRYYDLVGWKRRYMACHLVPMTQKREAFQLPDDPLKDYPLGGGGSTAAPPGGSSGAGGKGRRGEARADASVARRSSARPRD